MQLAHGKAMAWEMWRRGWYWFLLAVGTVYTFSMLMLNVATMEPSIRLQMMFRAFPMLMLSEMMMFISMMAQAQGGDPGKIIEPRFYRLPITTETLVAWRVGLGAALVALMHVAVFVLIGASNRIWIPLLVPILFLALAVAAIHALLLIFANHVILRVISGFALGLGIFFWIRHAFAFDRNLTEWPGVRLDQAVYLLCAIVAMFAVAVIGAEEVRRGDKTTLVNLREWWERAAERIRNRPGSFDSPSAAQLWVERREHAGFYAAIGFVPVLVTIVMWFQSASVKELLEAAIGMSMFCLIFGAFPIGLVLGQTGKDKSIMEMRTFRATRPVTDRDMSRPLLKSAWREMLGVWGVVLVPVAVVLVILSNTRGGTNEIVMLWERHMSHAEIPAEIRVPLLLAGFIVLQWGLLGVGLSLGLFGRTAAIAGLIEVSFVSFFIITFTFHSPALAWLRPAMLWTVGGGFLIVAQWIMFAGWRRGYVRFWIAALPLILGGVSLIAYPARHWNGIIPVIIVVTFVAAVGFLLATLPFAAAPLALSYNRHR